MSLARGLTTTSTRKRKTKLTKFQQEELERGWRERNVRLKEMYLPKETFEQYMEWVYGKGRKEKTEKGSKAKYSPPVATTVTEKKQTKHDESIRSMDSKNPRTQDDISVSKLSRWVTGACTSKPSPTYTGTKVVGIAVLHKSCLQPIFSQEEAIDVARMRR